MLMHHADACFDGGMRLAGREWRAEDGDRALIGDIVAEENVHQRRLARTVLAEESGDLAALQIERDCVIGEERPESLGDALEMKDGVGHFFSLALRGGSLLGVRSGKVGTGFHSIMRQARI